VPVNVRNPSASNAEFMAYVDTRWLFFHKDVAGPVREVIDGIPGLKAAICLEGEANGCPSLANFCAAGEASTHHQYV
jgi:hypothetical protein